MTYRVQESLLRFRLRHPAALTSWCDVIMTLHLNKRRRNPVRDDSDPSRIFRPPGQKTGKRHLRESGVYLVGLKTWSDYGPGGLGLDASKKRFLSVIIDHLQLLIQKFSYSDAPFLN